MKPSLLLGVFCAAFIAALAVAAPATLLGALVERSSAGRLVLAQPDGTIWRGAAYLASSAGRAAGVPVAWKFGSGELWRGRVAGEIAFGTKAPIPVSFAIGEVAVGRGEATVPAALLAEIDSMPAAHGIGGEVRVMIEELRVTHTAITLRAHADWIGASIAMSDVVPLGAVRVALSGAGRSIGIVISALRGPLGVEGTGEWSERGLSVEGRVRVVPADASGPNQVESLRSFLRLAVTEQGDGSYQFRIPAAVR